MPAEKPQDPMARPVLIGVFLSDKNIIYNSYHPSSVKLEMLNKANKQLKVTLYLFSLADIDYDNYMVEGNYFDHNKGRWLNKLFAFPDIIYIRDGMLDHQKKELQRFLRFIKATGSRKVNSQIAFNKWEVYQVLSSDSEIKPYLPETRLYRKHGSDLLPMLRRYGRVYLKACRGRQGEQVMQVTRLPDGSYEYRYFMGKLTFLKINRISSLFRAINHFFSGRDFIIQQPIELINLEGRKVDLRAEMQRNGSGELEVVAIPVRVARKNSPITTHASSYRFDEFFTEMMDYSEADLNELKNRLYNLLFKLYRSIEDYYGPFGEIGIDIGLDQKDKLWVIECNSLSAKVSLMKAYNAETVLRAFSNPLEYAIFIADRRKLALS